MKKTITVLKVWIIVMGAIASAMLALSFTTLPYAAYANLAYPRNDTIFMRPNYIVMLSGCGMPSADGMLKCYYTSEMASTFTNATIVVAMPCDTASEYSADISITNKELALHGIDTTKIIYEKTGINTHQQAQNIRLLLPDSAISDTLLIIAQPEQVKRSILAFKSVGFEHTTGCASESEPLDESLLIQKKSEKAKEEFNATLAFRYNFWNYLKLQITVAREQIALLYYKIRGWA